MKFSFLAAEILEQVAQRSCGFPTPGSVQVQIGQGFEKTGGELEQDNL